MKLFFAGSLGDAEMLLRDIKPKNILISYFYIRGSGRFEEINKQAKEQGVQLLVDSGAHTFFEKAGIELGGFDKVKFMKAKEQFDVEAAEQYFFQYLEFIKKYKIELPIELDIGALVGKEKIEKWRKLAKSEGITLIPVWHRLDGSDLSDWEEMCKEYPYVGIEGGKELGEYVKFLKIAEKYKTKVHAFAMTKSEYMRRLSFYSVDSTSWKSGSRFGATYVFLGNSLKAIDKRERGRFKNEWTKAGLDWDKINKDDNKEIDKVNAYAWNKLAKSLDKVGLWKEEGVPEGGMISKDLAKKIGNGEVDGEKLEVKGEKRNPADHLPKDIHEKVKDPEIEAKRLANLRKSLTNFKTGKFSKNLPLYCNNCYAAGRCKYYQEPKNENDKVVCALSDFFTKAFTPDKFDYREENIVVEAKNNLVQSLLVRYARALHFETIDGGVQDKSATTLAKMILEELGGKAPMFQFNKFDVNVNRKFADNINLLDDESKKKIIRILRESAEKSGDISETEREFIFDEKE